MLQIYPVSWVHLQTSKLTYTICKRPGKNYLQAIQIFAPCGNRICDTQRRPYRLIENVILVARLISVKYINQAVYQIGLGTNHATIKY